jgi:NAD dependent epimerase/dehydratase family enzyme
MQIALTGATGFIGKYLESHLSEQGHRVIALGRSELKESAKRVSESRSGCNVLINLAGAPISRRWTETYKKEMVSSRVQTTRLLVDAMSLSIQKCPGRFISAHPIQQPISNSPGYWAQTCTDLLYFRFLNLY